MSFSEANAVEEYVRDLLAGKPATGQAIAEPLPLYMAGLRDEGLR